MPTEADEEKAEEETESERRKRIQKEALAKLQKSKGGPTEVAGATEGRDLYRGTSAPGAGLEERRTLTNVEKAKPVEPSFTASQVKPREAVSAPSSPMPTQANWQERYKDASSFGDAVRMWRDEERAKAGPQKEAFKKAAEAK